MTWAIWLAAPVGATTLAALWSWWAGWSRRRAERPPGTKTAMREHADYLDALARPLCNIARRADDNTQSAVWRADVSAQPAPNTLP